MKITPSMIEAGVAAMARIKRQHPVDSSVVATVFSAMYAALERENKRLAGTLVEKKYEHQDWPAWRYGPDGTADIFVRPEDVPEGWREAPGLRARVDMMNEETEAAVDRIYNKPKRKYTRRAKPHESEAVS